MARSDWDLSRRYVIHGYVLYGYIIHGYAIHVYVIHGYVVHGSLIQWCCEFKTLQYPVIMIVSYNTHYTYTYLNIHYNPRLKTQDSRLYFSILQNIQHS